MVSVLLYIKISFNKFCEYHLIYSDNYKKYISESTRNQTLLAALV